jgi:peptidase E
LLPVKIGSALEPYLDQIAKEMKNYCKGRKTVVFLPLIATSQKFCRMLNDVGLKAAK